MAVTARVRYLTPSCEGEDFHDVCQRADCPVCSTWQQPGESREDWAARIRAEFQANPLPGRNQYTRRAS